MQQGRTKLTSYKINKIKLLHFKLLADLLATMMMVKKQKQKKNMTTGRQQIRLNVFDLQFILRRKKYQKYIL